MLKKLSLFYHINIKQYDYTQTKRVSNLYYESSLVHEKHRCQDRKMGLCVLTGGRRWSWCGCVLGWICINSRKNR